LQGLPSKKYVDSQAGINLVPSQWKLKVHGCKTENFETPIPTGSAKIYALSISVAVGHNPCRLHTKPSHFFLP
jgi:hypothetical protein